MLKIISVGESTVDYYPSANRHIVGGISLNFAVHAKRCGADEVSLVSCVGRDEWADLIFEKLALEEIDATHVRREKGGTAHCEIVVRDNGERYFPPNSYHQNVLASYSPSPIDLAFIQTHNLLVARYDISYTKVTFNLVMRDLDFSGIKVADFGDWFDYKGRHPAIYPYLNLVDLAFISGDEETVATFLPLSNQARAQIVVTLGEAGSVALKAGKMIFQPAIPVEKIVDTTGCGDAFQAAFTVTWARGNGLEAALKAGAENASKTLLHLGAT